MKRILIGFTEPQISWIKREAKKLGVSVNEFVRRVLDGARGAV